MPNPFFVPARTPAEQKLQSVMKRDLKDKADEVLSRPNARFPNGMWNPRVVSTEDVKIVAQVYPKVPEQQGRPGEELQPFEAVGRGLELANRPFQVAGAVTGAVGPALVAPMSPALAKTLVSRQRGGEVAEVGKQAVMGRISPREAAGQLIGIQEKKPLLQQFTSELPASMFPPIGGAKTAVKGLQTVGKTVLRATESALVRAPGDVLPELGLKLAGAKSLAGAEGFVPNTRLNIMGNQGTRNALEAQGIKFSTSEPTLIELVSQLDDIDKRLAAIPKAHYRRSEGLRTSRETLLRVVDTQSGLSERDLRAIVAEAAVTKPVPAVAETVRPARGGMETSRQVAARESVRPANWTPAKEETLGRALQGDSFAQSALMQDRIVIRKLDANQPLRPDNVAITRQAEPAMGVVRKEAAEDIAAAQPPVVRQRVEPSRQAEAQRLDEALAGMEEARRIEGPGLLKGETQAQYVKRRLAEFREDVAPFRLDVPSTRRVILQELKEAEVAGGVIRKEAVEDIATAPSPAARLPVAPISRKLTENSVVTFKSIPTQGTIDVSFTGNPGIRGFQRLRDEVRSIQTEFSGVDLVAAPKDTRRSRVFQNAGFELEARTPMGDFLRLRSGQSPAAPVRAVEQVSVPVRRTPARVSAEKQAPPPTVETALAIPRLQGTVLTPRSAIIMREGIKTMTGDRIDPTHWTTAQLADYLDVHYKGGAKKFLADSPEWESFADVRSPFADTPGERVAEVVPPSPAAAPPVVDEAARRRQLIERLQAEDKAAGIDAESFVRTADPSGGARSPRRPPTGTGGKQPPTPSEPDDIFRQVTEQATKREKIEQTLLRRHEAAITTAENEARVVVDQGNERLRALDIGGIRQGRLVPRETDIPVLDDLFDALHNPSKVASGEMRVPAGFENEYNRLRQLTNWEESMRIDFDPEMAKVEDYFYRGWVVPKEGVARPPAGIARGRLGTTPSFKKPRVDATYREMRDAGFEPLSFNPYEQWRVSRLQGVRYRQQMQLIDHLKRLDLAVTDASGVATEGWRTPKVGPAFEGKIFGTTDAAGEPIAMYSRRYVVPDDLAGRLESMYGVMPDLGNVHVFNRSFSLIKAIDAAVFIPKRVKLFGSAFQQVDFLTRSYIGGWSGMVDALIAGKPIEAVRSLAVIPRTTARIIEANFVPNARLAIRKQLDSTTPIIAGRPGIHLRGIMEAGLSTIDTTLLPANLDRTARVIAEEAGLMGNRAVRRALASLESSMRRGLFEGTYPAAQIETIKNSIAPRIVRLYGKGMSDEALNGMIAQATNKMFSTIPASQTVIQNRALREILRRVFFSIGESEGLLRQAFGTIPIQLKLKGIKPSVGLRRQESMFWAEHWLGAYLGLIALANAVHFASTGEPLPLDRYSPVSKDKWGPLPIGYNRQFASPNLPFRGSDGEQLMLDIVGQMDTAFRILDPISFLSSRESVPIRAFVTQTTERDFFGRPIDRVGPGGIYSRTANLINDMFTPIGPGQAALQIGLQRGNIPEGLIPSSEGRIGQTGQLVQATGLNVRAQPEALTPVRKRLKPIRILKKRELVGAR